MSVLYKKFELPENIELTEDPENSNRALVTVAPLEKGFGHTLGNALRRILLNSIESPAILGFMMDGISHEYSAIEGIKEDVTNIILNLKSCRLKREAAPESGRGDVIIKRTLTITEDDIAKGSGECPVTLEMLLGEESSIELINPEMEIFTVTKPATRQVQIRIGYGRGYVASEDLEVTNPREGEIIIDALYSPMRLVSYVVENQRVGGATDFDKLVMNIESDGRVTPKDAIVYSSQIAQQHFEVLTNISDTKIVYEDEFEVEESEQDALLKKLSKRINEIELSVRSTNCLSQASVETLAELVLMPEADMLQFRNFGKKSLNEIKDKLDEMGLHLGMDLSSYGITRENVNDLIKKYKESKQG